MIAEVDREESPATSPVRKWFVFAWELCENGYMSSL